MLLMKNFRGTEYEYQRYTAEMRFMSELAATLGVSMYFPNYHGANGDKNTVLFYTKEDEAHNREVDKQFMQYSASAAKDSHVTDEKYIYRDAFFAFENTDANGNLSYDSANFGTINLRETKNLELAIRSAYERKSGRTAKIGDIDPAYGGVITDVSSLPVGSKFFCTNGCWTGKIIEADGVKYVENYSKNTKNMLSADNCVLSVSNIRYEGEETVEVSINGFFKTKKDDHQRKLTIKTVTFVSSKLSKDNAAGEAEAWIKEFASSYAGYLSSYVYHASIDGITICKGSVAN